MTPNDFSYTIFLIISVLGLSVVWRLVKSKHLRSLCFLMLLMPVFSFRELSHKTLGAFFLSALIAVSTYALPSTKKQYKVHIYLYIALGCFIGGILGVANFVPDSLSERKTRLTMQTLLGELRLKTQDPNAPHQEYHDSWGMPLRSSLEKANDTFMLSVTSAGKDKQFGTQDDIVYKEKVKIRVIDRSTSIEFENSSQITDEK